MRIAVDIKTNQEPCSANPLKTCRFRPIESLEIDTPFVLHKKDVQVKDGVVYLPLYMAYLLANRR